jgi:hypothetical protein
MADIYIYISVLLTAFYSTVQITDYNIYKLFGLIVRKFWNFKHFLFILKTAKDGRMWWKKEWKKSYHKDWT